MYKRKPKRDLVVHPESEKWLPLIVQSTLNPTPPPGDLLKIVRTNLRMTQEQLSKRSGIVQAHIARMEAGLVDAQFKTWEKLFQAMVCKLALRVQAEGGLKALVQDRIQKTAEALEARWEQEYPEDRLEGDERKEAVLETIEELSERHTPEIWED